MFRYIAGNNFKKAINVGNYYIVKKKNPIINFAIENNNNSKRIYQEYKNLINNLPNNKFSIAFKLSSINFDKNIVNDLIDICKNKNIKIFIDAENNIYNNKYNRIVNELMFENNYENNLVYKTYQMYRCDSLNLLNKDIVEFNKYNIHLSCKLVRGAYWNSEYKEGHLFINKKDTDNSYNQAIFNIYNYNENNKFNIILATHNKFSIEFGTLLNNKKNIFEFAHLQGIKDNYYNNLVDKNKVHVYIPYGPYNNMIPYLSRRLYENLDVIKHMI